MDEHYQKQMFVLSEISHHYGDNVHILSDPVLFSSLAKLCAPETKQPQVNELVIELYRGLLRYVINCEFAKASQLLQSRMASFHPKEGEYQAQVIDRQQRVVSVDLARAGTLPSHVCYDALNRLLNPDGVRQDHVVASRVTNPKNQVVGTSLAASKIGGPVDDAIVLFPDPMGATGGTLVKVLDHYKSTAGKARKYIAMHLIITPEYLANLLKQHSDCVVYAVRLDRGLSSPEILQTVPGEFWAKERGLNDKQYIVPGGGGLGELLNNAYV